MTLMVVDRHRLLAVNTRQNQTATDRRRMAIQEEDILHTIMAPTGRYPLEAKAAHQASIRVRILVPTGLREDQHPHLTHCYKTDVIRGAVTKVDPLMQVVCHLEDPRRGMVEVPGATNILVIDHRLVYDPSMAGTRPRALRVVTRTLHASPILENQDTQANIHSIQADILAAKVRPKPVSPAVHRDNHLTV